MDLTASEQREVSALFTAYRELAACEPQETVFEQRHLLRVELQRRGYQVYFDRLMGRLVLERMDEPVAV